MNPNENTEEYKILSKQTLETGRDSLKQSLEKKSGMEEVDQSQRLPTKIRMKKGMRIHFYGYSYKVIAVRPNGKVTLRFDGHWKDS